MASQNEARHGTDIPELGLRKTSKRLHGGRKRTMIAA
jgi:hypothetical protein